MKASRIEPEKLYHCGTCTAIIDYCDKCGAFFGNEDIAYCDQDHHYCEQCRDDINQAQKNLISLGS